jgi:glutathione peroxidase-family protein
MFKFEKKIKIKDSLPKIFKLPFFNTCGEYHGISNNQATFSWMGKKYLVDIAGGILMVFELQNTATLICTDIAVLMRHIFNGKR